MFFDFEDLCRKKFKPNGKLQILKISHILGHLYLLINLNLRIYSIHALIGIGCQFVLLLMSNLSRR